MQVSDSEDDYIDPQLLSLIDELPAEDALAIETGTLVPAGSSLGVSSVVPAVVPAEDVDVRSFSTHQPPSPIPRPSFPFRNHNLWTLSNNIRGAGGLAISWYSNHNLWQGEVDFPSIKRGTGTGI